MPRLTHLGRTEGAGVMGVAWRGSVEAAPVPALLVWFSKGSGAWWATGLALLSVFLQVRRDGLRQETPNLDMHPHHPA